MFAWEISLPAKTVIGQNSIANVVPPMLVPKCAGILKTVDEHKPGLDKLEDTILDRIDLHGKSEWAPEDLGKIKSLIKEFTCILSQNDLDLGKTLLAKQKIKLTDKTLFKGDIGEYPLTCMMRSKTIKRNA